MIRITNRIQLATQLSVDVIHYYHRKQRAQTMCPVFTPASGRYFDLNLVGRTSVNLILLEIQSTLWWQSVPSLLESQFKGEKKLTIFSIQNQYDINGKTWAKSRTKSTCIHSLSIVKMLNEEDTIEFESWHTVLLKCVCRWYALQSAMNSLCILMREFFLFESAFF